MSVDKYAATWATFKPKLKKIKKMHPEKKFLYFRKRNFLATKKLNETFLNFLASKNFIKLFDTLNKTPVGESGCLRSLYLLAAKAFSFLIHFLWLTRHYAVPEVTIIIWFFVTHGTICNARGHHSHFPLNMFLVKQRISLGVATKKIYIFKIAPLKTYFQKKNFLKTLTS